ncbi:hypothetical protein JMJ35_001825 [Cladonia borealis]|uniref:Endonuclease/exonuclease/phosphatase domain-containing protein n=1 Tax=Cladonia borealis TaxID=184061 RepID=A0AA39R817_9LECA|nr:hypothetical protein JMJ35_001825 [Cladonia borealis]
MTSPPGKQVSFGTVSTATLPRSEHSNPERPQPYYAFSSSKWQPITTPSPLPTSLPGPIKLITWNIDFRLPHETQRMTAALAYLHTLILALPSTVPAIIFLQEMVSTDLEIIKSTPWLQSSFHITDTSSENWAHQYGTTTLIDKRLPISSVFRRRYISKMGRDALFVDIRDTTKCIRFCNTHLESLIARPALRPAQVKLASGYLHDADGGVIVGDFNAIEAFDGRLHVENGLKDAYLENGGVEGEERGWTWGMQSGEEGRRYGCSRMDKVMFCGRVEVRGLERIGEGVKVRVDEEGEDEDEDDEDEWEVDLEVGERWVTDHLGLMADLHIL